MNYEEAINYIKNTSKFSIKLGLSRTEKILELLGNPHKKIKCIHIAGTNGKGSTTAMINRVLIESGYKVGMYISPYLEVFEERIQINGENIPKNDLIEMIEKVSLAVSKAKELGYTNPTEFEIITCAMFLYFYEKNVDFAVIEVGLGGRLDSTNVITPILSIITSISLDHMKILGDTLGKIAFEKAGIIKEGVPLILYPQEKEAFEVIEAKAKEMGSEIITVNKNSVTYISNNNKFQEIKVKAMGREYYLKLSLLGEHQLYNAATAIYAIGKLEAMGINIEKEAIEKGLKNVTWPGRLEVISENPLVVLDGAHNKDGIEKLSHSVDKYFEYEEIILILGILGDKAVEDMVRIIVPKAKKVITVTPHNERGEKGEELLSLVKRYNNEVMYIEDYKEAYYEALKNTTPKSLILICGSLYMIGDMRTILKNR